MLKTEEPAALKFPSCNVYDPQAILRVCNWLDATSVFVRYQLSGRAVATAAPTLCHARGVSSTEDFAGTFAQHFAAQGGMGCLAGNLW